MENNLYFIKMTYILKINFKKKSQETFMVKLFLRSNLVPGED